MFKINNKIEYVVDSYISPHYFTYCLGAIPPNGTKRKREFKARLEDDAEAACEASSQSRRVSRGFF